MFAIRSDTWEICSMPLAFWKRIIAYLFFFCCCKILGRLDIISAPLSFRFGNSSHRNSSPNQKKKWKKKWLLYLIIATISDSFKILQNPQIWVKTITDEFETYSIVLNEFELNSNSTRLEFESISPFFSYFIHNFIWGIWPLFVELLIGLEVD